MTPKVGIVGAGASGIFCGIHLAYLGCEVEIFERNSKPGLKILVSGGGRCNFTNLGATHQNYLSQNSHFCRSALSRFTSRDFLNFFDSFGLRSSEKKVGQLFCEDGAKELLNHMLEHSRELGVRYHVDSEISDLDGELGSFMLTTAQGKSTFSHIVIASGGLSWPKLGVSGMGYQLAKKFGHTVTPLSPGLVPLLWSEQQQHLVDLSGISLPARVSCEDVNGKTATFEDDLLFTHHGISGPVTLQISNYWRREKTLSINCFPQGDPLPLLEEFKKNHPEAHLNRFFEERLPKRLVRHLLPEESSRKIKSLSIHELKNALKIFTEWQITPRDHAGFGKAEVTLGGIDTQHLSSKTLESQLCKGLYFVGEVVDVTGQLGGYNFQWAWSSAWAAAQAIGGDH